jgi:hypothetical protein
MKTLRVVVGWVFAVLAFGLVAVYSIAGYLAYNNYFDGWRSILGLGSPLSALGLPFWGRGEVWGWEVKSFIWWWLAGGAVVSIGLSTWLLGYFPSGPEPPEEGGSIIDLADL